MKKKVSKKKKITKRKVSKTKRPISKSKRKTSKRKNPRSLTRLELQKLSDRPDVEPVKVKNFLTLPGLEDLDREFVDGLLFDRAYENNFKLSTTRAIRDGLDLMFGTRKQVFHFSERDPAEILGQRISKLPRNWY